MATHSSPRSQHSERFKNQPYSQESATLKQNFLAPLGDSQETHVTSNWDDDFLVPLEDSQDTQDLTPKRRNDSYSRVVSMVNQSTQPDTSHFITRPLFESPSDFQHGFQYSKAPIPQKLLSRLNPPRDGVGGQENSKSGYSMTTRHASSHEIDPETMEATSSDSRVSHRVKDKVGKIESAQNMNESGDISVPNKPPFESVKATNEQFDESSPRATALRPLFQNNSPSHDIFAPFHQIKARVSSPASRNPRLPKGFAAIQRKALIQSNNSNHLNPPTNHHKPRAIKGPPGSNPPRAQQHAASTPGTSHMQRGQHQVQPNGTAAPDRSPDSSVFEALTTGEGKFVQTTHSPAQETRKDDNLLPRPMSQASNISKIRAPQEKEQNRIRRQPNDRSMEGGNTFRELTEAWNRHFSHEIKRNAHWQEKMDDMVAQLAERDEKVDEYLERIQIQEQIIADLENTKVQDLAKQREQQVAITELDEQRQRLREKMKDYRTRLNEVTNEQQSIFKYFQPRYHDLREQMSQADTKHQESLKQALCATEQVRDKLQKSMKEVQTLSQQEIQNLRSEIQILQTKLAEREKEVDRERDHVNDLRRELEESHELNRCSLKSLNAQNQALMERSDARATQVQTIHQCIENQKNRMQSLQKFLEDDILTRTNPSELVKSLEDAHDGVVNSIIRELSERAELDRKWSSEVTEGLKNDILGVREFCFNLSEQIQSHQSAAQWQDKFSKAQMDHQALLQETDRLKEELAGMHIEADTQRQQRETLQQQLNSLSASAKITDASNKLIETLQKEKQRIQEGLNEKESLIRTLEEKLREVTEALSVQKSQFKDQECRFQYDRAKFMETIASCHEQRDQAINQAREEYTRIQTKYHDVENRLRNAEQNYSQLQIEVVQAKQGAEHTLRKNKDEVAKQAQQLLVPIADLIEKTSEGLQTSEQVNDNLNKKLEAWSQDHVEVSLLRQAFQKLAKDYKTNTENGKILVNFLEVQKEMENTWRWHKSEVNALNRAIELEKGVMADTEGAIHIGHKGQPNISHVIHRRVMIQSPAIDHDRNRKMTPVSIEEERVTRRQAAPVKGIMKPAALQRQEKMEEQHHQKDQTTAQTGQSLSRRQATSTDEKKSILVSHSAYNRPVLGSAASLEECNIDCMPEEIETASTEVPVSKKRQRVEMESNEREKAVDKISHAAHKRRVKISRSMST